MARWDPLLEELLGQTNAGETIGLDDLAAAAAPLNLDHDEIGALIDALEAQGRKVGDDAPVDLREELRRVLDAARSLRSATGKAPSIAELVERTGLSVVAVRRALQFGRIAGR